MKMTISKKIAFSLFLLYPGLAIMGLIGIAGIDAVSDGIYTLMDQNNFIFQLEETRAYLLKGRAELLSGGPQVASAYLNILKHNIAQILDFLQERSARLGNTWSKEIILKALLEQLQIPTTTWDTGKIDNFLLAIDVLIKNAQNKFRQKVVSPYKTQATAVAGLSILTLATILGSGVIISYVNRSIRQPLREIIAFTRAISEFKGDLSRRLDIGSEDEIGELSRSFNQMLDNLAIRLSQVKEVGLHLIDTGGMMKEITQRQTEIILRQDNEVSVAKELLQGLQETAGQIAHNSQRVSEGLATSAQFTNEGQDAASLVVAGIERIRQRMDSAVQHLEMLDEKSKSVNKILDWIEDISKKIDLLALNFNIEVNKAEAPEGLAVLAKEVRRLSELSQGATTEIRTTVERIESDIRDAVSFADSGIQEVKEDLMLIAKIKGVTEKINTVTEETNRLALQIKSIIQKQEKLFSQSVRLVLSIQELSKESLLQTQGIENLSRQIDEISSSLKQSIGEFKLG